MDLVAQYALYGLVSASMLALPASALTLVYGLLHYPNFAIAELVMVGAYVAISLEAAGVPLPVAVGGAGVLVGVLAVALDQGLFRRVRRYGPLPPLLMSIGVMFILQNAVRFVAGNRMQAFDLPVLRPIEVLGLRVGLYQVVMVAVSAILLAGGHLLLARTRVGKAIRATADNPEVALASGIDAERVARIVWLATGLLAGVAGGLLAMETVVSPLMGWNLLLPVFAVAVLGGLGSLSGALVGALIVGLAQEWSTLLLPATYKNLVAFAILSGILLWRPSGLLGRARPSGR
jgi:branched-chain amino acid transport system permease protein/neutral amino acid transport system permease protein